MSEVMEKVKERPILFSGEMVRAILAGNKTMTRRVMKPQPVKAEGLADDGNDLWIWAERKRYGAVTSWAEPDTMADEWTLGACPYGKVGDRLWVRETWRNLTLAEIDTRLRPYTQYRASEPVNELLKWKPSIFMPRWVSRILLEVTGVRVERVQATSEDDAVAEGYPAGCGIPPLDWYADLWDTINAKRGHGWKSNPFVWVVEFRRIA